MQKELVSYVERHLAKGISASKIKKALLKAGYSKDSVDEAMEHIAITKPYLHRTSILRYAVPGFFILLLIGFAVFFFLKGSETVDYVKQVEQVKKTNSYIGLSDVQLYALAKDGDMAACDFMADHNNIYYCKEKVWANDPCRYMALLGEDSEACYLESALSSENQSVCDYIHNASVSMECKMRISEGLTKEEYLLQSSEYYDWYYAVNVTSPPQTDFVPSSSTCPAGSPELDSYCYFAAMSGHTSGIPVDSLFTPEDREVLAKYNAFFLAVKKKDVSLCPDFADNKELCTSIIQDGIDACDSFAGKDVILNFAACQAFASGNQELCQDFPYCFIYFKYY